MEIVFKGNQSSFSACRSRARLFRWPSTWRTIALTSFLQLVFCSNDNQEAREILNILGKPSLYQIGDSISTFWPSSLLEDDYNVFKVAFPARGSQPILESTEQVPPGTNLCILNGGINDYLNTSDPEAKMIDTTAENMQKAFDRLHGPCGRVFFLNVWIVHPPWPTNASLLLNARYKEMFQPYERIDPEGLIHKEHTLDGVHLTDEGYQILTAHLRARGIL